MKEYLELFRIFFVVGATMFGGGYAMVPVLERELIKKRGWINMDEVMDYYSIAQFTPGIISVNVATFVGFKRKGIGGGIVATIALMLPGLILMTLISLFLQRFADYELARSAFAGIRIAVCALILDTLFKFSKGFLREYRAVIILIAAFVLSVIVGLSPVIIILAAGAAGFITFCVKRKTPPDDGKKNN